MSMSRRVLTAVLLLTALGSGGCSSDETKGEVDDGTMLSPYLAMSDALAKDTTEGLSGLATHVVTAAKGKATEPGVEAIAAGAAGVGAQDIATARTAFEQMSEGMITWMQAHPESQAGMMIVHCTMTFDGDGGRWVQPEGKVMNPYEGARMLSCGDKIAW